MARNIPVFLTDKESDALINLVALAIVRSERTGEKHPNVIPAVLKIQQSKYDNEIEIPEERLKVLEY